MSLPFSFPSPPTFDPLYPLFPICAFLGFLLVFIPLPWHVRAQNAGTCAYIFWAGLSCLFEFVNAVVWRDSTLNVAPVWCDISTKFMLGASVGIPASALCISRRLYKIAVIKTVSISNSQKRRALLVDLSISFGIPAIVMALHVVVQGHRFDILGGVGCYPAVYNSLPAYFLVFMWPTVLGCISFIYSGLTLRAFYKRRLEFSQILSSSSTSLNKSRYLRLMVLAAVDMAATIPLSIYSMYLSTDGVELGKYVSWAYVHYDFGFVGEVPAAMWMGDATYRRSVEMTRWLFVGCALLFFLLFGMAEEARRHYKETFVAVVKRVGWDLSKRKKAPSSYGSDR
ncbi:STE3-like pheromone receptor [Coniophora puteana RWD-64-598 SS2]|uniref:STE3-like pheromone receptor n=1 Tax=Coniophora puteana (strain RWD-64-598) TaxID=741705 RepID=A0A5M3M7M6_CONPW|nr:STE3-like pheromone receptor [Coniophora puteana RWD-64-598 SS2]EIW74906.1 STE3-like pheromone receptor [Coniophora puteana RWD-64-598 SS2]